jgi:hypothetical protein
MSHTCANDPVATVVDVFSFHLSIDFSLVYGCLHADISEVTAHERIHHFYIRTYFVILIFLK